MIKTINIAAKSLLFWLSKLQVDSCMAAALTLTPQLD